MENVNDLIDFGIYFAWLVKSVCNVSVTGIYMCKHGKYMKISHQMLITGKLQVKIYAYGSLHEKWVKSVAFMALYKVD